MHNTSLPDGGGSPLGVAHIPDALLRQRGGEASDLGPGAEGPPGMPYRRPSFMPAMLIS